jgi:biotin carboxyl carrier protein
MRYFVHVGGETVELEVERSADGFRVRAKDGREVSVSSLAQRPALHTLLVDGHNIEVQLGEREARFWSQRFSLHAQSERERAAKRSSTAEARGAKEIAAPMPGRIVRVSCAPGQPVTKGESLVVIEAMKMQNELCAKADGVVRAVRVSAGENVDRGAVLIELE